ncbi:hypothetical protein ACFQZC_26670 [Streptacidiphilus monticola]
MSAPTSSARSRSVPSMVRLRDQRSTNTPATGPTSITAAPTTKVAPLTAAGAQERPRPSSVAIHSTSVVSKT